MPKSCDDCPKGFGAVAVLPNPGNFVLVVVSSAEIDKRLTKCTCTSGAKARFWKHIAYSERPIIITPTTKKVI